MKRLRPMTGLALVLIAVGANAQTPVGSASPRTDVERYSDLLWLRIESFRCGRATRPGGTELPSTQRMREATARMQGEIRAVLAMRAGEERISAIESEVSESAHGVYWIGCDFEQVAGAQARYRRALYEMQRRLGLPVGSHAVGAD